METFTTAFNSWDGQTQLTFSLVALGIVSLTLFLMTVVAMRTLRVLIRGYPPAVPAKQECNNDDNLTGLCLKPAGCKTVDECSECVSRHGQKQE
jgi:hypothetical protein